MKRHTCLLIGLFWVMAASAITEKDATQIVINYYSLLTEVSKTSDKKVGARDAIGELFIHKDGWIFNDIEYIINKLPQDKGVSVDSYIISMYGNNLFGSQFSPTNITAIRRNDNDWQINYSIHVYKQNVADYNISLQMCLTLDGKIRYIEKSEKDNGSKNKKESPKINRDHKCNLWVSDTIIKADCEYHSFDIQVKSDLEWDLEFNRGWKFEEYSPNCWSKMLNWWCDWSVMKRNDSTLSIDMLDNLRTSTYIDSVFIKAGDCKKKIIITQSGYNHHKAVIYGCSMEFKKEHSIVHVDFDNHNYSSNGVAQFFLMVEVQNAKENKIWENKVEYRIAAGKNIRRKDYKIKIPHYYASRGRKIEVFIGDFYGNKLAARTINIDK